MTRTIYVPEGEEGDEAVMRIIPSIWRMVEGERNRNRDRDNT